MCISYGQALKTDLDTVVSMGVKDSQKITLQYLPHILSRVAEKFSKINESIQNFKQFQFLTPFFFCFLN